MNLNFYDDMSGMFAAERDSSLRKRNQDSLQRSDYGSDLSPLPAVTPLAMAYVPFQSWGDTMTPDNALECGTLFNDLVYPFKGGDGK